MYTHKQLIIDISALKKTSSIMIQLNLWRMLFDGDKLARN